MGIFSVSLWEQYSMSVRHLITRNERYGGDDHLVWVETQPEMRKTQWDEDMLEANLVAVSIV